jgi:hypothetical protein
MAEMERFERSQDFSRHLSGVLPCQLGDISKMAEGYGVEPYTVISRRSFQDCLTHSTVGPSLKFGRTLGFEPRISILETDGLPVSLHP